MPIQNTTTYDKNTLNEGCKVLTRGYVILVGTAAAVFVLMAMITVILRRGLGNRVAFIYLIGAVLMLAIGVIKITTYKKALIQRLQVVNRQDAVECKYLIDDEKIEISTGSNISTLLHKDIKKFSETRKLYVINYRGGIFAIIAKAGFEGNGEQEFKKLMECK